MLEMKIIKGSNLITILGTYNAVSEIGIKIEESEFFDHFRPTYQPHELHRRGAQDAESQERKSSSGPRERRGVRVRVRVGARVRVKPQNQSGGVV